MCDVARRVRRRDREDERPDHTMVSIAKHFAHGLFMGSAELVPGVSSATVALVFGIYRRLVGSLSSAARAAGRSLRLDRRAAARALDEVDWALVVPLAVGAGVAVATLSHVVNRLLGEHPVEMSGVFFGMVAASAVVAWRKVDRRDVVRLAMLAGAGIIAFALLGLRTAELADPALWQLFAAGAVAISALILPGVSGAFFLVVLGLYRSVLEMVVQLDMVPLAVFATGCAVGLAVFSRLLRWLLEHHSDAVLAVLAGVMVGSLRVLWPWPAGLTDPGLATPPGTEWVVPLLLAVAAAVAVVAVAGRGSDHRQ